MNKKTVFKMIIMLVVGGVFGVIFSLGLKMLSESGVLNNSSQVGEFFVKNTLGFEVGLILFFYIPAVYLHFKGKKIFGSIKNASDEEVDVMEKAGAKSFDLSLSINAVLLILNLMLFGMSFDENKSNLFLIAVLFMVITVAGSILEIVTVRFIQKRDNRLKGDPSSFRFIKDFLESCDEAEKLKIYKSGYHAFQISKKSSIAFVVLAILCNLILETGPFPIFISGMMALIQLTSYSYYAMKKN